MTRTLRATLQLAAFKVKLNIPKVPFAVLEATSPKAKLTPEALLSNSSMSGIAPARNEEPKLALEKEKVSVFSNSLSLF